METNALIALLRRLAPNQAAISTIAALVARLGAQGVVALARGYLGPLADRASAKRAEDGATLVTASGENAESVAGTRTVYARMRAATGLESTDLAVLGLALTKLVFEVGEIALYNPTLDPEGKQPKFELDEAGRPPAMSIAHVAAATRLWQSYTASREAKRVEAKKLDAVAAPVESPRMRLYAARSEYYSTTPRYAYSTASYAASAGYTAQPMNRINILSAPVNRASVTPTRTTFVSRGTTMATSSSASRGCGTCGGSHSTPTPQPTPTFDPCARGLPAPKPAPEGCGCGCGGKGACGCGNQTAVTKTYDNSKCPTFAISCETKTALRDCVKTALCDFLRCVTDTLCPDGKFELARFDSRNNPEASEQLKNDLIDCVGQLACSFLHCIPDALCPPPCEPPAPPIDCLPCDYAVEVLK